MRSDDDSIRFVLTGIEVRSLYTKRAETHRAKAAKFEGIIGSIQTGTADAKVKDAITRHAALTGTAPDAALFKLALEQQRAEAEHYDFLAKHIDVDQTYRLTEREIRWLRHSSGPWTPMLGETPRLAPRMRPAPIGGYMLDDEIEALFA